MVASGIKSIEEVVLMPELSEPRILRRREVERLTRLSKASIYRQIHSGSFPRPLKLGERAVGWRAEEIEEWLASRERAGLGGSG